MRVTGRIMGLYRIWFISDGSGFVVFAKSQVPTKIETQQNYLYFFIEIYNCLAVSMIKTIISYKSSKENLKKLDRILRLREKMIQQRW